MSFDEILEKLFRKLHKFLLGKHLETRNKIWRFLLPKCCFESSVEKTILKRFESYKNTYATSESAMIATLQSFYEEYFYQDGFWDSDFCYCYRTHLCQTYFFGIDCMCICLPRLGKIFMNLERKAPCQIELCRKSIIPLNGLAIMDLCRVHEELKQKHPEIIENWRRLRAANKIKKWWISLFWDPNTKVGRKRLMRSFENEEYSVW